MALVAEGFAQAGDGKRQQELLARLRTVTAGAAPGS